MIKSKIDARERALELAIAHYNGIEGNRLLDVVDTAQKFESYLIGDAELPEVIDDNAHLKELIEMAKKSVQDINKQNDDLFGDIIKTLHEDVIRDKGLVGLIPCKSEAEQRMSNDKVNWKQTRVDAAISAMNGILSRNNNLPFNTHEKEVSEEIARISVALADALIAELKKTNETK